ncbi:zinc finger protein 271-like [Lucilia cuprina]|uniref:zinc finger protein 271-like n=1 Tax=Lucilia cuprina TaxID=7375 RepID=UPI001F057727|nr:zinc finger protein 271-like [Lucilia cuprina]
MSSLTRENIPHLCRACLRNLIKSEIQPLNRSQKQEQPHFYHIERTQNLNKWMAIINPLEDVTRLSTIVQHQKYPEYVCRSCYENFKHVNDFKEMVVHSFSVLTKLLTGGEEKKKLTPATLLPEVVTQSEVVIKSEPIDDDDDEDDDEEDDEEFMDKDWQPDEDDDNASNDNALELQRNIKLEDTKFVDPLMEPSSSSSNLLEKDEGQPKATKAYKCPICKSSYIHRYTYVAHIRQMHLGIEHAFECDICHKTYTKFCNLYRHMRKDHNQSLRQYKCEYSKCNRSFRQLTTRRKHYEKFHNHEPLPDHVDRISQECLQQEELQNLQHSPAKTTSTPSTAANVDADNLTKATALINKRSYICPICAGKFETSYDLKVHMNNDHKDDLKFRCNICGKHKISQLKLDEHITTVHENPMVTCHVCKKILKSKSHLRQHILSVHNGVKPFSCEYCPARFAAKNTLKVHTRLHTGEKPFKCSICDRRFTQLTPMKKHLITHEKGHRNAID